MKIVTSGVGTASIAITKLMMSMGLKNMIMTDRKGAIYEGREGLNPSLAAKTRPRPPRRHLRRTSPS